ncbi:MAG: hypothetical protein KME60_30090 [Cyanomargarita calcarea GSE-NOS-MK-12-04C]|uniref:Tetratricopeptide repeat protein n=1 Tax=Cyanomargarita calcarea GSE-NOS-MK-12-04C TaxID=2839659 RepID=A0A951UVV3_9CYAN|nr:hypothetical protein [Cyanomargarita calcarea GSE-NOS-MK-12-04C]
MKTSSFFLLPSLADFTSSLEINPNLATAHFKRGFCYYLVEDTSKAQADFLQAAELFEQQRRISDSHLALDILKELRDR